MLHHAFVPTHPEPTSQRYTTKPQTVRFSSHTSVLNFAGTDYTSHVCQPWTNVAKIHHKTSDPKIFMSHIPLSNFAGAAFHIPPRMCANLSWTNLPRHTTYKLQSENFHLTHPCFELCRNNSKQMTPRMCANPEPTFQRYTTKPQTLRLSSHTSVLNFAGAALHIPPRMCANPSWTNLPRHTTYKLQSENFHLEQLGTDDTTHVSQPWTNFPKIHHKTSNPKIFISHICFELCRNSSHVTPHLWANWSWTNVPKTHHKSSDPKIFISHIPVLIFAGAALHITPHMWANPSWTNVPRHTTNFRSENFHLTHPCFELCRNSSPCYATHVSQPILYQRPKIHHKRRMTQFCKLILIQPPKIHLSKFQFSPYRRKKCWALQ